MAVLLPRVAPSLVTLASADPGLGYITPSAYGIARSANRPARKHRLGWWSYKARQQRAAVAALRQTGAFIDYDFDRLSGGLGQRPTYWPAWLVDSLGVDYFATPAAIYFPPKTIDSDLKHLETLSGVEYVRLHNTRVTDSGLKHLRALTNLTVLDLSGTQVTDAGPAQRKNLTALSHLDLARTTFTDAGLLNLKDLKGLREVHVQETKVTEPGTERLRQHIPNCVIVRNYLAQP